MYKLLIVDDEPQIVDWLYELLREIDHIELDIYKAYSGTAALEWLNKTKIDIVLTDICMPGISGLQLLEKIHNNWPGCKVIFLTGYSEFDYIYTAIQHEGVSYLLKTEEDEEIIKAVEKAVSQIEKGLQVDELIDKARQKMQMAVPLLQKEYINGLIHGEDLHLEIKQQQLDELDIPLRTDVPVILLLGRVDNLPVGKSSLERMEYLYGINLLVQQHLTAYVNVFHSVLDHYNMVWIIQQKELLADNMNNTSRPNNVLWLRDILETIQAACKKSLAVSLSFVLSSEPFLLTHISDRFAALKVLLDFRIGAGLEMILLDNCSDDFERSSTVSHDVIMRESQVKLGKIGVLGIYLERGEREEFFKLLSQFTDLLKGITGINYNPALELYFAVSLMFLSYINRWHLTEKIAFKIGLSKLTRIDEHVTWSNAAEYLYRLAVIIFDLRNTEQENRAMDAVTRVQHYIHSHLNEDISLIKLAELIYFNPSYLSRLFKQVTGCTLSDYICDMRIKKAKELLEKGDLKIHEIASIIGYESSTYFARFFKKSTNMTPQEYRDAFLNK